MFHDETHTESHLERSTPLPLQTVLPDVAMQRKRMLMALGILVVALVAVVVKDWDFWFPPDGETPEAVFRSNSRTMASAASRTPAAPARERKPAVKSPAPAAAAPEVPLSATSVRTTLPPLQVEVVAGNRHMNVPAKSNAIHLDVDSGSSSGASSSSPTTTASNAAGAASISRTVSGSGSGNDRVQLSPQTAQSVSVSVPPDYPLLARQMKVQGAVSLQALISRDGSIQELQILSGPTILATAAREAVKQWHFKPYLQNGQPVETQAKITVNFTISTN
ncbi:MAG: energy transducer TonB [Terriglobales bacterium]